VLLLVGLAGVVWPRAVVRVTPVFEATHISVPVNIDLEVAEPVLVSSVLPGKLASAGEKETDTTYLVDVVGGQRLVVSRKDAQSLVYHVLLQAVGEGMAEVTGARTVAWGAAAAARSGHVFRVVMTVNTSVYRDFPLNEWRNHIAGLSRSEAEAWLRSELGVKSAVIELYPSFLAKISQKVPGNQNSITFSLDTK
jgi:hypothetical protein